MKLKLAWPASDEGKDRLVLAGILLIALTARLALFAAACYRSPDMATLHTGDTRSYIEPATSLLKQGEFSDHGVPELIRTPGYPILLTLGIALGHVELITFALQTLLSLVTVAMVYQLTRSFTGSRPAAVYAGLFLAVEPLSLIYTSYLMAETLFTCLLVLMVAALANYDRRRAWAPLVAAGLLLAAASLVRPVTYYLPPLIALALAGRGFWRAEPRCFGTGHGGVLHRGLCPDGRLAGAQLGHDGLQRFRGDQRPESVHLSRRLGPRDGNASVAANRAA